jgi:UDP-N-acetylmuramoylalanine--D-glutamate ligase
VLIGRDGPAIEKALGGSRVPRISARTMEEAVDAAFQAARAGDAVLLSPACASYDMFRSYVHRGEVFVEVVRALKKREEGKAAPSAGLPLEGGGA